jgi:Gas vesicle synthesis protein GvpL/GvpF
MADEPARWAADRAAELLARAEAEAVEVLRDMLVDAALAERRPAPRGRPAPPARRAQAPPGKPPADLGDALWAYCVLHAETPAPAHLTGVHEAGVRRVESGALAALVSPVPLAEFGADPLRANLNDLEWLERTARSHERVLDAALAAGTLVPLRLCTIYENDDSVTEMLERESGPLLEALERLEGHEEWGVKLLVDRAFLEDEARRTSPEVPALEAELEGLSGGGEYMLRRRLERHVRELADRLATEVAEDVHGRLEALAADAVTLPAQNRELSGRPGDMLVNGAYLVEADRVQRLGELARELEEQHRAVGAQVELTGPWPPYNFAGAAGAGIA